MRHRGEHRNKFAFALRAHIQCVTNGATWCALVLVTPRPAPHSKAPVVNVVNTAGGARTVLRSLVVMILVVVCP